MIKIKGVSEEFKCACEFLGINAEEYLSKITTIFLILFAILGAFSIFFGLKVLYFSIVLLIIYLFLQEYPKIVYKRALTSHYDEIPYFLSLFSSSYSMTGNIENAFFEVENFFKDNLIVQEIERDFKKRYIRGKEDLRVSNPFVRRFFEYISMSFSTRNKENIVKRGFHSFMEEYRKKKITGVNKIHLKILFLFVFGTAIPLILLTSLPVISFFLKGYLKYIVVLAIFFSSILLNVILIYDMKGKITFLFERIKKKSRKPLWIYLIPFAVSFPSVIYAFKFLGIYAKIDFLRVVKLNLIPFSIALFYFLYTYYDTKDAIKIEREIRKELDKIVQFLDAISEYLEMKVSFENSLRKSLERVGLEDRVSFGIEIKDKFFSKTFRWLIRKIIEIREKGYKVLLSFIRTFRYMIETLEDYMEELRRRTQGLSNIMKYTALFILPIMAAVTIKASAMIFSSYEEVIKLSEVSVFLPISTEISEWDISMISFLLFSYSIFVSYLLLDFSLYLEYGETPSKRRFQALYLLLSSIIFLVTSVFLFYL